MGVILNIFKYCFLVISISFVFYVIYYHYVSGETYLPKGYYYYAKKYAPKVEKHDKESLKKLLMNLTLPPYKRGHFDCFESAAFLEWYLEGAGFHTYIAESRVLRHAWVIVELENREKVAIEAIMLTENYYNPPGIIDPNKTCNLYITNPPLSFNCSIYYDPPILFENPGQAISDARSIKYPGTIKWSIDEIDWWNVKPFSQMNTFKDW